ncbi:MAG TPA: hypothetical protein VL329_01085 [Nitrospiraceae bacterium]|nr:hypothetical protein [Nitrospiraceae bacterium]
MTIESTQPKKRGGFSYRVTDEQIQRWRALSSEEKLQWLEDANRFLAVALTPAVRAIQERFRRGDL